MKPEDYDTIIRACFNYHSLGQRTFVTYRNGLTKAQTMVINMLSFQDGLSMKLLGERIHITKDQLSRVVTALEEKNLVTRLRPQENKRTVKVFLTEDGRQFLQVQFNEIAYLIDKSLSELTQSEKEEFLAAAQCSNELLRKALGGEIEPEISKE